jgi:PAS domain-containing protein
MPTSSDESAADGNYPAYILFCDLTPLANIGIEPEEMIGRSVYDFLHPDEIASLRKTAVVNQQKDVLCELIRVRAAHKDRSEGDGGWVVVDSVINVCKDYFILISRRRGGHDYQCTCVHSLPHLYRTNQRIVAWKQSAELVIQMNERGEIDPSVSHSNTSAHDDTIMEMIYQQLHWETVNAPNERRACLILNRFTLRLTILYAIPVSTEVLNTGPAQMNLRSLYDFVQEEHCAVVKESIDRLKTEHTIQKLQFPWRTLDGQLINCRFVFMEASDGIVCIALRIPPFT